MAAVCRFRRGLARRFFARGVWRSEVDGDFWTLLLFPFQGGGFRVVCLAEVDVAGGIVVTNRFWCWWFSACSV